MEKRILEIIRKADRYPAKSREALCREIADIFRRFGIWCLMEYYEYFESGLDNEGNYQFFDMQGNEITFNNIFDYWWNEIKDK